MAIGDLKGTLLGVGGGVASPTNLTGSVSVSIGDLIFVAWCEASVLSPTGTVTDNLGNTYVAQNAGTDAGNTTGRAFYSIATVAGTLTTISVAAPASGTSYATVAGVFQGPIPAIDTNPANNTDSASPYACPATGTLAQAAELVIAWGATNGGAATATAPNTLAVQQVSASFRSILGSQVVASTASVTPVFTATGGSGFVWGTASFKAGGVAALVATGLTVSSPVLGAPAYTKNVYHFIAATREFSPIIGAPALGQKFALVAAGLTVGRPFIQIPGLTGLTGMGIGVGSPVFGTPILTHPWGLYTPIPTVSAQIVEADVLLNLVLDGLIKAVPTRIGGGRAAWDFRRAIGIVRAYGRQMIFTGTLGQPLVACFNFATAAKASFEGYERLRRLIVEQVPFSLPAQATAHLAVQCTLAQMVFISAATQYRSRDQALTALKRISEAYAPAEEDVADEADPMMYQALVHARATAVRDLAERGRQLPRVIEYHFAGPKPGLWITHRLYDDATRFEELRDENDWIHPAFCPEEGHYLSRHLG